jgi:hypothetical protein
MSSPELAPFEDPEARITQAPDEPSPEVVLSAGVSGLASGRCLVEDSGDETFGEDTADEADDGRRAEGDETNGRVDKVETDPYQQQYEKEKERLERLVDIKRREIETDKLRAERNEATYLERRGEPAPPGVFRGTVVARERALMMAERELEFLRPSSDEDVAYRIRVYDELPGAVRAHAPEGLPLRFHGSHIYTSRDILEAGGISSSADRIGIDTSWDTAGHISVTIPDDISHTVHDFTDLNTTNYCTPAGCIFVMLPADQEDAERGASQAMANIDFSEDPSRLCGIMTSPENIVQVREWASEAGIDPAKVSEFFEFVEGLGRLGERALPR